MSQVKDGVLSFLVELGVFSDSDVAAIRAAQVGPIVRRMLENKSLSQTQVTKASELLNDILSESNHTRRLKAQMSLMQLITGRMHDRVSISRNKIKRHKEKITSGDFSVVPRILAKAGGD